MILKPSTYRLFDYVLLLLFRCCPQRCSLSSNTKQCLAARSERRAHDIDHAAIVFADRGDST